MRAAHGAWLGHGQGHAVALQATRGVARPALVLDSAHVAVKAPADPATGQVGQPMGAPEAQEPSASAAAVPALISASRPRRSLKPKRRTRQVSELPQDTDAWPPQLLYLQQLQQMLEELEQELDRAAASRPGASPDDSLDVLQMRSAPRLLTSGEMRCMCSLVQAWRRLLEGEDGLANTTSSSSGSSRKGSSSRSSSDAAAGSAAAASSSGSSSGPDDPVPEGRPARRRRTISSSSRHAGGDGGSGVSSADQARTASQEQEQQQQQQSQKLPPPQQQQARKPRQQSKELPPPQQPQARKPRQQRPKRLDLPKLGPSGARQLMQLLGELPQEVAGWVLPQLGRRALAVLLAYNTGMVVSLATSSRHLALPHGDRVSAGLEGLAIGLWRFDPGLPYALGTFVLHWVRCKMGRAASTQAQLVRSPEHQQLAVAFVRKAEAGLEAVDPGARQALVVQAAAHLRTTVSVVQDALSSAIARPVCSLEDSGSHWSEAPANKDFSRSSFGDMITSYDCDDSEEALDGSGTPTGGTGAASFLAAAGQPALEVDRDSAQLLGELGVGLTDEEALIVSVSYLSPDQQAGFLEARHRKVAEAAAAGVNVAALQRPAFGSFESQRLKTALLQAPSAGYSRAGLVEVAGLLGKSREWARQLRDRGVTKLKLAIQDLAASSTSSSSSSSSSANVDAGKQTGAATNPSSSSSSSRVVAAVPHAAEVLELLQSMTQGRAAGPPKPRQVRPNRTKRGTRAAASEAPAVGPGAAAGGAGVQEVDAGQTAGQGLPAVAAADDHTTSSSSRRRRGKAADTAPAASAATGGTTTRSSSSSRRSKAAGADTATTTSSSSSSSSRERVRRVRSKAMDAGAGAAVDTPTISSSTTTTTSSSSSSNKPPRGRRKGKAAEPIAPEQRLADAAAAAAAAGWRPWDSALHGSSNNGAEPGGAVSSSTLLPAAAATSGGAVQPAAAAEGGFLVQLGASVPLNLVSAEELSAGQDQWQPWVAPRGLQQQEQEQVAGGHLFQVTPGRQVRPWAVQLEGRSGGLTYAAAAGGEGPGGATSAAHDAGEHDGGSGCMPTDSHMLVGAAR